MKTWLTTTTLLLVFTANVAAHDPHVVTTPWNWSDMSLVKWGEAEQTGSVLYTSTPDTLGAAFRCQKGKLYAFLAVKKIDLHDALVQTGWHAKTWNVTITIGDGEPKDEQWVSFMRGKILGARSRGTSRQLLDAARAGTTVSIDQKYGQNDIDRPAGRQGRPVRCI